MKRRPLAHRFEYGDRFQSERDGYRRARWRNYLTHLTRHGVDGRSPALMALVGEVMHDAPLRVTVDSDTGDVIVEGRNTFRRAGRTRTLALRFRGCTALSIGWGLGSPPSFEYFQSELHWPAGPGLNVGLEVRIRLRDPYGRPGWICLGCQGVSVDAPARLVAGVDYPKLATIRRASR